MVDQAGGAVFSDTVIIYGRRPLGEFTAPHLEVGIGDRPGLIGNCLSLNHKVPHVPLRSATEFVARASEDDVNSWREAIPFSADGSPFAGLTIAVEDASPDTCIALYCLKERLAGRIPPPAWIEFASEWEQGYTSRGVDVESMAGALVNALTHAMYDSKSGAYPPLSDTFRPILTSAVAYIGGLISVNADPWNVPRRLPSGAATLVSDLHEVAHASLARERLHYARALASAVKVQLSVPIVGTHRRMDIDAVFMTEVEFTGVLKVLLRRDATAPLGHGYPLWGLYRPTARGTGFDMTISTDPAVRIDLKLLWIEIERAEERAWSSYEEQHGPGHGRPREPVRDNMYSFREKPPICVPSCQPWWEGRPLYSMIAAPKSVVVAGESVSGTRLEWSQILELLWQVYAPVQNLSLRRFEKPDETAWQLLNKPPAAARRVLVDLRTELYGVRLCLSPATDGAPIAWSPVVAASLAAFVDVGRVEMGRLPAENEFDVIEARGGIVLVTSRGMMLLEVVRAADFPMRELDRAARDVAATSDCARAIADHINSTIRPLVINAIDTGSSISKRRALKAIYGAKLKARQAWAQSGRFEEDILIRQFRELCERRWNGAGRLTSALEEVAELEAMVVSSSDVRAATTLNAIAFVGFPLSICGNLLGGLLVANEDMRTVTGVVWPILGIYLAASVAILALVWAAAKISDRQWQPDRDI